MTTPAISLISKTSSPPNSNNYGSTHHHSSAHYHLVSSSSIEMGGTDVIRSISPSPAAVTSKKIGLAALSVLAFYTVSGGPFGIEDIVRASKGNFFALCGFVLMLVWSVPEALITAELSTVMPESSGSVAWVDCAFGRFWAFQKGWLSLLSGVSDNALYPILFLDCLLQLLSDEKGSNPLSEDDGSLRWVFIIGITLFLTYLNYRGLEVVGNVAIAICILSLLPFLVFCILGLPQVDPSRWLTQPPGGMLDVDWRLLLNTFFWNINFWESASSFSGDVENPSYNYPRGMAIAVIMVFLTLFIPILIGTGISQDPYSMWTDGYFVHLASSTIGPWMGVWMMAGAAVTNIGMFEAEMSSDAWQVAGMADRGILPKALALRNDYGAPTYGVLISATGVICLGWMSFSEVVDMLNLLYCYGQLIEFAAYLKIRLDEPLLISENGSNKNIYYFSFPVMCVALVFPTILIFIILYFSTLTSLIVTSVLALSGVLTYYLLELARHYKICEFNDLEEAAVVEPDHHGIMK